MAKAVCSGSKPPVMTYGFPSFSHLDGFKLKDLAGGKGKASLMTVGESKVVWWQRAGVLYECSIDEKFSQKQEIDMTNNPEDPLFFTKTYRASSNKEHTHVVHRTIPFDVRTLQKEEKQRDIQGVLPNDCLVYRTEVNTNEDSLSIYPLPAHYKMATLTLSKGKQWGQLHFASVSGHKSGCFVVVNNRDMEIFDEKYKHDRSVDMSEQIKHASGVKWTNAVAAFDGWIMVAETVGKKIHVYNWAGKSMGSLDNSKLGLKYPDILGIGKAGEDLLVVAAGKKQNLKSLHLFRVE